MNADRLNELAALNAVGALDGAELQEFNSLLAQAGAPQRAAAVRFNDAAALMGAFSAPRHPPAELKSAVLGRISGLRQGRPDFYSIISNEGRWRTLPVPGVRVKDLAEDPTRGITVKLYELAPGTRFPSHPHAGPEECFVVSGDFHVEDRVLHGGDFHHAEEQTEHVESFTEGGCTLLVMATTGDAWIKPN